MFVHTNLKIMCISVKGVKLWNSLDSSLMCCRSVHYFKNKFTDNILNSSKCLTVLGGERQFIVPLL